MVEISNDFWKKWNFPNCVGAIDGKHIRIFSPKNSGTLYFNYIDFFSIVLLAIVDANCKFIFVDIGSYGKEGDSGIFTNQKYQILPYVIVGDGAFRLDPHMMRSYSKIELRNDCEKKNFNYRLSRARRTTENSFGLLSQVFGVFYTPIPLKIQTVDKLVLSACCLHNLLRNQ
ncbi:protein ANTAGONIST OF LIKE HETEROCHROMATIN PROTEIN 1-like [Aphis craccivora]|uniref:Protein ANTAGONIST OF LIKE HETEROCHROMATIN PROTEIN 1-like n=1 Tax=Aphis craccivora TaxID=307492 RepID=A0A6G0W1M4_APHCR|nr:protein ANTAGONIST OF LIKE HETEROCHROMATIN PROTEIN 1-like [Aphis craccivora]